MSQDGQCGDRWQHAPGAVIAATFPMPAGVVFDWHTHHDHQLGLATGQAVGSVARHVGYQTPSAFVAAFRKETGLTPAAYFRAQ